MRQNQSQHQKRSRGRGRRNNNGHASFNRNTTFESNGPEGRLRGNAQQLFEKYTALAQDANGAGERISAEAFSQFADHYYRIYQTILQAAEQQKKAHEERRQSQQDDGQTRSDSGDNDASPEENGLENDEDDDTAPAGVDSHASASEAEISARAVKSPRKRSKKAAEDSPDSAGEPDAEASEAVA
jgi:hypothetical protein